MKAIKCKDTKMEILVSKALWHKGIRFRKNVNSLMGKPDIAIKKYKIVIFLDSCFWHKCPMHYKRPKSNNNYWDNKIERNFKRDIEINHYYLENGWHLLRIWEHEFKTKNLQISTINKIINFIELHNK